MHTLTADSQSVDKELWLEKLLTVISESESAVSNKISLVASENVLSPLAKLPFLLDIHSRYFLDDLPRFGRWYFPNGSSIGKVEQEILIPLVSKMFNAAHVNIRPISGMNCMITVLTALTQPGETVFTIPFENGGHASTTTIIKQFGRKIEYIPFENAYDIDYPRFKELLKKFVPALIYLDQSNLLFPIDPQPIRDLIEDISPKTILHYDSSHTNGLIAGKALFNPLERGAHCMGGSTHKTLPGPHKGLLATNDQTIAMNIQNSANHFISHHHSSSVLSLAVTLIEMKWCNGEQYAKDTVKNAKIFAETLTENGFYVAGKERNYTACHQIWAYPHRCDDIYRFYNQLTAVGIITNLFDSLPGISQPGFRFSVAEITKLGATENDVRCLAFLIAKILKSTATTFSLQEEVKGFSRRLSIPKFCFGADDFNKTTMSEKMKNLGRLLFALRN